MLNQQSKDRGKTSPAIMCIKILLHIFNFLYLIIGICVFAIGIWTQVQLKNFMKLSGLYYDNAAYIMIGVGVLIMLVAVGGFYCTAKDKIALLYMYGIFITLIAILQIGAGIAGGVFAKQLDTRFLDGLDKTFKDYSKNKKAWDWVQEKLKCCGVNGSSDWGDHIPASCYPGGVTPSPKISTSAPASNATTGTTSSATGHTTSKASQGTTTKEMSTSTPATSSTSAPTTSSAVPPVTSSTAAPKTTTNTTAPTTAPAVPTVRRRKRAATTGGDKGLYTAGCHGKVTSLVNQYLSVIVGVCVGFVVLQIVGAILACCLAKKTSRNNYEQIY